MARYRMVESKTITTTQKQYQLTEADVNEAKGIIGKIRLMSFKTDWSKIEKEIGVEVPQETRDYYDSLYKTNKIKGSSLINLLSVVGLPLVPVVAFFSTHIFDMTRSAGDAMYINAKSIYFILLGVCYYYILVIADACITSNKISSLDIDVAKKIVEQMKEKGINKQDIKNAWGKAYGFVSKSNKCPTGLLPSMNDIRDNFTGWEAFRIIIVNILIMLVAIALGLVGFCYVLTGGRYPKIIY